MIFLFITKLQI